MDEVELCFLSASRMAECIRRRELSPVEIVRAVLDRIERLDPTLHAFVTRTPDLALDAARRAEAMVMRREPVGPLHGVPVSVKDSIATRGVRTTFGSRAFADHVPQEDAPLVERLRAAGAIVVGKTAMPEFAWKAMTDSPLTGVTRNPWSLDHTPGGSSGGASAQVAAGMGPVAIGTDGGGSIRIPAAFSHVYGIKPTFGRVPVYPSPAFDSLSHPGPITRTVADAALVLSVLAGPHPADRLSLEAPPADYVGQLGHGVDGLRVAWSVDLGHATVDPGVRQLTTRAAHAFTELGCHVEEVVPDLGDALEVYRTFFHVGAAASVADLLPRWQLDMDPGLVNVARSGMRRTALEFAKAQVERHRLYDRARRFFERFDLLLTPTVPVLPFRAGAPSPAPEHGAAEDWIEWSPFSFPFNLTQLPAASVPVGFSSRGLPVGLQIVGRRFADLTVLQASAAYEAARPWTGVRPSL